MLFETTLNLLYVENSQFTDKKTGEVTYSKILYFNDPATTRVSRFRYKGEIAGLIVGNSYSLAIQSYEINGKAGFTLKTLTPKV